MGTETLKKEDIARRIAEEMGFSLRESKAIVNAFFNTITSFIKDGQEVKIVRFGTFSQVRRQRRFKEGTKTTIAFQPSKWLKGYVNAAEEVLQDK